MALYLVTGGSGFIGSNLVHALIARGERVRVLDNLSTGRQKNLQALLGDPARAGQIEFWRGDITDPDTAIRAVADADFVLHQAALPSVPRSVERPMDSDRTNAFGTLQLLDAVRLHGPRVRRFVLAASSSAYGERAPDEAKVETMMPSPMSPYAAQKLACENYCGVYYRTYGVPTVALRYFNVFGPRQDPTSQYAAVIPNFINAYLKDQAPTVYGDGLQSRDFCFVDNVVEANLLACTAPIDACGGQVINIACGESTTLLGVLDHLSQIFGKRLAPSHLAQRAGDVRHSLADITRARQVLGYSAKIKFAEGLRRTVAWYREQQI